MRLFKRMEAVAAAGESDGFRVIRLHRKKEILKYLDQWWEVLEASVENLYGGTLLDGKQKKYDTKRYLEFVNPNFMIMAADRQDRTQGLFLGLPSLSRPFQKAKGWLLPFGFLHFLQGFKNLKRWIFILRALTRRPMRARFCLSWRWRCTECSKNTALSI